MKILGVHEFLSTKNWIINGDMQVSQRGNYTGVAGATSGVFYVDRWKASLSAVTANKTHISSAQPSALNGSKSLKIIGTPISPTLGYISWVQQIEDYKFFSNNTITASAWVKSNSSNARLWIQSGGGAGSSTAHTGGEQWELLKMNLSIATAAQLAFYVGTFTAAGGAVTVTNGDYVEITGVKFQIGDDYVPFEPRTYAEELKLCERYYEKSNGLYEVMFSGDITNGGNYKASVRYNTQKRTAAVPTLIDGENGAGFSAGAPALTGGVGYLTGFTANKSAGGTNAGSYFTFYWNADAEI